MIDYRHSIGMIDDYRHSIEMIDDYRHSIGRIDYRHSIGMIDYRHSIGRIDDYRHSIGRIGYRHSIANGAPPGNKEGSDDSLIFFPSPKAREVVSLPSSTIHPIQHPSRTL